MNTEKKGPVLSEKDPSKEQIAAWKKEHNTESIHVIKVTDKHDKNTVKKAFLRGPNIDDLSRATGSERAKAGTHNRSLFENCVLHMHPDIAEKPFLYNGAIRAIGEIEIAADSEVEKL